MNRKEKGDKKSMENITIYIPECYDENIQSLIQQGFVPSRSEAIRTAIREFIQNEYSTNLEILNFSAGEQN